MNVENSSMSLKKAKHYTQYTIRHRRANPQLFFQDFDVKGIKPLQVSNLINEFL